MKRGRTHIICSPLIDESLIHCKFPLFFIYNPYFSYISSRYALSSLTLFTSSILFSLNNFWIKIKLRLSPSSFPSSTSFSNALHIFILFSSSPDLSAPAYLSASMDHPTLLLQNKSQALPRVSAYPPAEFQTEIHPQFSVFYFSSIQKISSSFLAEDGALEILWISVLHRPKRNRDLELLETRLALVCICEKPQDFS